MAIANIEGRLEAVRYSNFSIGYKKGTACKQIVLQICLYIKNKVYSYYK